MQMKPTESARLVEEFAILMEREDRLDKYLYRPMAMSWVAIIVVCALTVLVVGVAR